VPQVKSPIVTPPRFKVTVVTNSGKTLSETKKDINVSDEKYQGIKSITFELTNCGVYQSYEANAMNIDTGKQIDSVSEKENKKSRCTLFTLKDDQVKDEGTYEVNFTGVDIGSKDEQAKTIKGNSLDVIYKPKSNDTHKDPAFKVTVVTDKGSQELTSDTTITNTITSIKYELTNASEFKSYDYEIKRDATQIKQGTAQTSGTIATISGADVKSTGDYTLTFKGTYADGTQSKEFNAYKVTYKPASSHKDPAFKVTVVTDKGSQELTSDTTITNTITSIKYELTNASEFKSYDYEIKRDATQIKQGTAQTSGTIATISGADVKSTGDYTLTFKGTYADGTQSKEFNAYKVTYSKPVTNITFKLNIYNQSKTKNGTYGVGDSQMNDFPLNEYLNYNVYIDNYTTDYAKISYTANMGGKTDEKNDKELKDKTILSGEYEPRLAGAKNDFSITVTSVKDKNGNELLAQSQKIKVTVIWAYS
jgi:hypothetical protein